MTTNMILTDHEIKEGGLPDGATGVRWIGENWADCAGVLENNYWDADGMTGEVLFDLPGMCDLCADVNRDEPGSGDDCTMLGGP